MSDQCQTCGRSLVLAVVAHPLHFRDNPGVGLGECRYENVAYCERCQPQPSFHGSIEYYERSFDDYVTTSSLSKLAAMTSNPVTYVGPMSEDDYLAIVERIQQAMAIEPFRPPLIDVVKLLSDWRDLSNQNERLRKIERAARAAVETQKATGEVRLTLLADVLDENSTRTAW